MYTNAENTTEPQRQLTQEGRFSNVSEGMDDRNLPVSTRIRGIYLWILHNRVLFLTLFILWNSSNFIKWVAFLALRNKEYGLWRNCIFQILSYGILQSDLFIYFAPYSGNFMHVPQRYTQSPQFVQRPYLFFLFACLFALAVINSFPQWCPLTRYSKDPQLAVVNSWTKKACWWEGRPSLSRSLAPGGQAIVDSGGLLLGDS